ncbi:MAG: M15 family metallopeptidase [Opitutaceae bacterium]
MADASRLPVTLTELHHELGIPTDYAAKRGLTFQPEAQSDNLVLVTTKSDGTPVRLVSAAATAWRTMQTAAHNDGITLSAISGHRSVAHQAELIRRKLADGQRIGDILTVIAAPGYSEHHTGRALDIATPADPVLEERFAKTTAFAWLQNHAPRFGFRLSFPPNNPAGFTYEPWHWFWVG